MFFSYIQLVIPCERMIFMMEGYIALILSWKEGGFT